MNDEQAGIRRSGAYVATSLLLLVSGGTALVYEVLWFKRFAHVWGNSSLAVAAVVASFLLGLGVGAYVFGRVADRVRTPLFWYGILELGVMLLALLVPVAMGVLGDVSGALHPVLHDKPVAHFLVRVALTFIVIGPACILMGGTLPLVVRQFADRGVGRTAGWLYAVNTFGAGVGCYVAGLYLLPSLGIVGATVLAVASNLLVALVALTVGWRLTVPPSPQTPRPQTQAASEWIAGRRTLYGAALLTGAGAMALEMVWTRQLALILGGSTYAFTAMLFVVLGGIGLGSLLFNLWVRHFPDSQSAPLWVIGLLAVATLAGKAVIPQLTQVVGLVRPMRMSVSFNALTCVTASAVLELLPAVAMGFLFPLLVHMAHRRGQAAGRAVGTLYTWNVIGTLAGTSLTPVLLFPAVGTAGAIAVGLVVYAGAIVLLTAWRQAAQAVLAVMLVGLVVGAAALSARRDDPRLTDMGLFLYEHDNLTATIAESRIVYFREGASGNVLVTEQRGKRFLRINGKVDASSDDDMQTQLGLAYLPRFLVPEAKRVMVIGFGSGVTPGASLLFPDTQVTCCEIEPAVFGASHTFASVNHSPERSDRFTILFDDARSALQGGDEPFDLVISEPSNPWMAGVSNVMTVEFYGAVRRRLAPGGLFAQWIQAYAFTVDDYALLLRTLSQVFPHHLLLRLGPGDTLFVGSSGKLDIPPEKVDAAQRLVDASPAVQADLNRHLGEVDVRSLLLAHVMLDKGGVIGFLLTRPGTTLNTDLNLRLEFDAPLRLFDPALASGGSVLRELTVGADLLWHSTHFLRWKCTRRHNAALRGQIERFVRQDRRAAVRPLVLRALSVDPEAPYFLAEQMLLAPSEDLAELRRAASELACRSVGQANRVGTSLAEAGRHRQAVAVLEGVCDFNPKVPAVLANLAMAYNALGQWDQAEARFEAALRIDPFNDFAGQAYRRALQRRGGTD